MLDLTTPLSRIQGIGPRFLVKFKSLNIHTVRDLLWHFPFRYEDFSQIYRIDDLEPGQQATVQGTIQDVSLRRSWQRNMTIVEATIEDDSGNIRAIWFNQPYLKNTLKPGQLVNFSGKVTFSDGEMYLSHPTYEFVGRHETKHTARLVPIYSETRGLTSKGIRFILQPILKSLSNITDWIPDEILEQENLPELKQALHGVHLPETIDEAILAKKRFVFEDLFLLQLFNLQQKIKLAAEKAPSIPTDIAELKAILQELPFELTPSQKRSLWEVIQDISKQKPMNRLLQGDVGSGKTVVAALTALLTAKKGYQAAFMAPTEILANQHFSTMKGICAKIAKFYQSPIGLVTGSQARIFYENDLEATVKRPDFIKQVKKGDIKIVIGTHALIQKDLSFQNLGLVIIDEQHRFGVEQRAALSSRMRLKEKGRRNPLPHFLSMSATPIPRTLMLTIFGDLDLSTIDELPANRKAIITKIISPNERSYAYDLIREQIKQGRQAFVICPRIDPPSPDAPPNPKDMRALEVKSVKEEFEKLSEKIFPDLNIGMLHGQMPSKGAGKISKESVMKDFRDGKIDVLVSTSVIEVGVDVPNATIMIIEGSDRFGLAQLYQFRGRVGRGEHQSFCFLFTDSKSGTTGERLNAILSAKNGFELAEKDLSIRGPGEFLGQRQAGMPDIAMRNLQDADLIKLSRHAALQIVQKSPDLRNYPLLRERLQEMNSKIHKE